MTSTFSRQFSQIKDSFCQPQFVSNPVSAKLCAFVINTEMLRTFQDLQKNRTLSTVLIKTFLVYKQADFINRTCLSDMKESDNAKT